MSEFRIPRGGRSPQNSKTEFRHLRPLKSCADLLMTDDHPRYCKLKRSLNIVVSRCWLDDQETPRTILSALWIRRGLWRSIYEHGQVTRGRVDRNHLNECGHETHQYVVRPLPPSPLSPFMASFILDKSHSRSPCFWPPLKTHKNVLDSFKANSGNKYSIYENSNKDNSKTISLK